jgi:hypothetical protein
VLHPVIALLPLMSRVVTNLWPWVLTTASPRQKNFRNGAPRSTAWMNSCTRAKSCGRTPLHPPASTTFLTVVDRTPPPPDRACAQLHPQVRIHCVARVTYPSVGAVQRGRSSARARRGRRQLHSRSPSGESLAPQCISNRSAVLAILSLALTLFLPSAPAPLGACLWRQALSQSILRHVPRTAPSRPPALLHQARHHVASRFAVL